MADFLAVDTSSRYLTVLAKKGEKMVKRFIPDCALNHSVVLMDEVDAALAEAQLLPADCDFFAAVTGPGSFTGIRIGLSTVKGFALATNKKMLAVTSFDLIAYNVNGTQDFLVCIDAAHDCFYTCGYNGAREITTPPCYLTREQVQSLGLPVYGFEELNLPDYHKLSVADCLYPAICALKGNLGEDIHALYVRKSQAEEARKC